ncbi:MAG: Flp pilus assembly complex ATPase component TadA [Patescibacteria group bacterium]|nr:Flp pilus assembly complex ATPase component TadA [Patescibacteria group bacterium]
MIRKDLAKAIAKQTNLNSHQAENLIIAFGAVVSDVLARGEKIVYSNFGTFYTVHYPSKVIFHPKFGAAKKMVMLPTNAVKWMPSGNIKDLVKNSKVVENATLHGAKRNQSENLQKPIPDQLLAQEQPEIKPQGNTVNKSEDGLIEIPIRKVSNSVNENASLTSVTPVSPQENDSKHLSIDKPEDDEPPVNIYEELMGDGSKEEATFGDAIRVHKGRARSLLGRIFKKNQDIDTTASNSHAIGENSAKTDPDKISLVNSGMFEKESSSVPISQSPGAKKIDSIKTEIKSTPDLHDSQKSLKEDVKPNNEPIEITPFSKTKDNISFIDLSKTTVSKDILQKIPEKLARQYKLVPVEENEKGLVVAMADPQDLEAKELIKKQIQTPIIPILASGDDINFILDQYNGLETEVEEAIETADQENKTETANANKADLIESVSDNAPASRIVTSLLRRAIRDKASDIHIEPSEKEVEVRFRLDGVLKKKITLPLDIEPAVVSRIKILSNLKIDEQRLPQDGRFTINFENRKIDFRVSTMPVANGEKIVMRVLDKMTGILTVEELGVRGSGLAVLKDNIQKSHGMTLVTGPTGSGKTTTLYALIDKLYSEGVNIVTLEDPIEYRMPGINQSQVNAEIHYTFASGLRSIVRQDPDIIMIGEIRDKETAEMAVHAALTGHIVLSTLHTNDATGAAPRLIDMGVEPFLLTSALNVVVGQRLARKICSDCKEEIQIAEAEKKKIEEEIEKMPEKEKAEIKEKGLKFFHGKGCKNCGDAGYKGRIGLYEVLSINESIKEMILNKKPSSEIQAEAVKSGMVTMLQDGILKVCDGITTVEEVWRVTKD